MMKISMEVQIRIIDICSSLAHIVQIFVAINLFLWVSFNFNRSIFFQHIFQIFNLAFILTIARVVVLEINKKNIIIIYNCIHLLYLEIGN